MFQSVDIFISILYQVISSDGIELSNRKYFSVLSQSVISDLLQCVFRCSMHFYIIIIVICSDLRSFFLCISSVTNSVPHHSGLNFRIEAFFLCLMPPVQLFFARSLYILLVWCYLRITFKPFSEISRGHSDYWYKRIIYCSTVSLNFYARSFTSELLFSLFFCITVLPVGIAASISKQVLPLLFLIIKLGLFARTSFFVFLDF
jgi:hypothetical protein